MKARAAVGWTGLCLALAAGATLAGQPAEHRGPNGTCLRVHTAQGPQGGGTMVVVQGEAGTGGSLCVGKVARLWGPQGESPMRPGEYVGIAIAGYPETGNAPVRWRAATADLRVLDSGTEFLNLQTFRRGPDDPRPLAGAACQRSGAGAPWRCTPRATVEEMRRGPDATEVALRGRYRTRVFVAVLRLVTPRLASEGPRPWEDIAWEKPCALPP